MTPTEHSEQCAFVERCLRSGYPYNLIFAIPNAGMRSYGAAAYMTAEGLRAGVPDLCLPVSRMSADGSTRWGALFIEMKRKGGKLAPTQVTWIADLRAEGYYVAVCYGQDAAWDVITAYVQGWLVRDAETAREAERMLI